MDNDQIRLKLIDPYFRKFINWRGIENVLEIPKDRLKNVLHQYKGYHFTLMQKPYYLSNHVYTYSINLITL